MQVSELKLLFADLGKIIKSSGAKAAGEFEQVCELLTPFDNYSISELTSLLTAAEKYRRTGILTSQTPKPKFTKAQPNDELTLKLAKDLQEFDVYSKTPREIEEFVVKTIGKQTAATKTAVAKQMGIEGRLTGPVAVKEITGRLQGKLQMAGLANAT